MDKLKVVVCGTIKNGAKTIEKNINSLLELQKYCLDFKMVLYENDSTDGTTEILNKIKSDTIHIISEQNINVLGGRTVILSWGRNKLLEYINTTFSDYDYVIMSDLDDVLKGFKGKMVQKEFEKDLSKWDVLTANCIGPYYDIYALRCKKNKIWELDLQYDCWDMINHTTKLGFNRGLSTLIHVGNFQKVIPTKEQLISVDSAFGGMGIYKMSIIKNCYYNGMMGECSCKEYLNQEYHFRMGKCSQTTCEHVSFHKQIRENNNGRIFICPSLLVYAEPQHIVKKN
jgi:glycosyltransferase involved in cell wall biosynthesis